MAHTTYHYQIQINGTQLADPNVEDKDLDIMEAVRIEGVEGDGEDDDRGAFRGFCAYNDKVVVFGNDGIFAAKVNK